MRPQTKMVEENKFMGTSKKRLTNIKESHLFDKVVDILEQARGNVVKSVNSNMVVAYWHIGREIVQEIQTGKKRAEYGKQVLEELSDNLNKHYGLGFSVTNLRAFRLFFQSYPNRLNSIQHPVGAEFKSGFNPRLSWSHYRALLRVKSERARIFYEKEAAECGWGTRQLERQIQTSYFERILDNHEQEGLLPASHKRLPSENLNPIHVLKSPMVLEFLDLPDDSDLHESKLEQAIINNLQSFLLELGTGFSFVARQKHIHFSDDDFYIDLVFYNNILKCFLLIDLKLGKLTHRDVGQMDGYVRLFEDQFKIEGDNPTVGLILCSGKNEAVAKYSVLSDSKQLFASKYLKFLPTEEVLKLEIESERKLIEEGSRR